MTAHFATVYSTFSFVQLPANVLAIFSLSLRKDKWAWLCLFSAGVPVVSWARLKVFLPDWCTIQQFVLSKGLPLQLASQL